MVCLHYVITEMGSFPVSVANNFCDYQLPKYLDSKTVLIYRPHPVYKNFQCIFDPDSLEISDSDPIIMNPDS